MVIANLPQRPLLGSALVFVYDSAQAVIHSQEKYKRVVLKAFQIPHYLFATHKWLLGEICNVIY